MGMSSSQGRLLALTTRKHNITRELMIQSNRKKEMTREASEASKAYMESFNANIFKWSPNGGATYTDITYAALMSPTAGVSGATTPILLTDNSGRVVVDDSYAEYAKLISPNGAPDGDWESNRLDILAAVIGVDRNDLVQEETRKSLRDAASVETDETYLALKDHEGKEPTSQTGVNDIIKKMSLPDEANIQSASDFESKINNIKTYMKNSLSDEDYTEWEKACDKVYSRYSDGLSNEETVKNWSAQSSPILKGSVGNLTLNNKNLLNEIFSAYNGEVKTTGEGATEQKYLVTRDRSENSSWTNWKKTYDMLNTVYQSAAQAENEAYASCNELFDQATMNKIEFYDKLFTAIAEQGWTYDNKVSEDSSYLNEMLQNNSYNLTMMSENYEYKEGSNSASTRHKYDYNIGSVYYNDNIIKVKDPNVKNEALAVYEDKKTQINAKEKKIDERVAKLEEELQAINTMIKGIEEVRDKNTETYFGIFA